MSKELTDRQKNAMLVLSAFQNADVFYCNNSGLQTIDKVQFAITAIKLKRLYNLNQTDKVPDIIICYSTDERIMQYVLNLKSLEEAKVEYSHITMTDTYGREVVIHFHRLTELNIANPDSQD